MNKEQLWKALKEPLHTCETCMDYDEACYEAVCEQCIHSEESFRNERGVTDPKDLWRCNESK